MNNTKKLSNLQSKYLTIINSGKIEEREIISLKSWMGKDKENARFIFDALGELSDYLTLSDSQNTKGYDFLMDQWKTPTGKERINNPFGYREQNTLDNFSHFELGSFYDCSRYGGMVFYIPIYMCIGKDGSSFEYYYNGKVNIIG